MVGQGYVGLPLSIGAAEAGFAVVGLEKNEMRARSILEGLSFVSDVSSERLKWLLDSSYEISTDYSRARDFDFAVITVPTPLRNGIPDVSSIEEAAKGLGPFVSPGSTIILESTTYPGTTRNLLVPILEKASNLTAGEDFFVGYSPERIDPGNAHWHLKNTPKVVSGLGDLSQEKVIDFYSTFIETLVPVSRPEEAELTKLLENTYRHVNIALVNEIARFSHQLGIDVWEAIDAASTKPFGYMRFRPGPGVGGHCLPIDPTFLAWRVEQETGHRFRFVDTANQINREMPIYVADRAREILSRNQKIDKPRVCIVGLSYKSNSSDIRESPSLSIWNSLSKNNLDLRVLDSLVSENEWPREIQRINQGDFQMENFDLVIISVLHEKDRKVIENITDTIVFDTTHTLPGAPNVEFL